MKKIMKITPPARPQMIKAPMVMAARMPKKMPMAMPKASKPGFLKKAVSGAKNALAKREAASKGKYTRVGTQLYKK